MKERGAEPQPQRRELEEDEEQRWTQTEETERKRREEADAKRWEEAMERQAREMERQLEEERRRQEEDLIKEWQAAMEDEQQQLVEELKERAEEVDEWMEKVREEDEEIRGDIFQLPPKEPEESATFNSRPPAEAEGEVMEMEEEQGELVENQRGLPPGCDISDVTVTCDGLKLTHFPPLAIAELKSLSLEGESLPEPCSIRPAVTVPKRSSREGLTR